MLRLISNFKTCLTLPYFKRITPKAVIYGLLISLVSVSSFASERQNQNSAFVQAISDISKRKQAASPKSPLSRKLLVKSSNSNTTTRTPALDLESLRSKTFDKTGKPLKKVIEFAQAFNTNINLAGAQQRQSIYQNGVEYLVWTHTIESPNAYSINLGFGEYSMPAGGSLFIYADNYDQLVRAFTAEDNEDHGELWTPMIEGNNRVSILKNLVHVMSMSPAPNRPAGKTKYARWEDIPETVLFSALAQQLTTHEKITGPIF